MKKFARIFVSMLLVVFCFIGSSCKDCNKDGDISSGEKDYTGSAENETIDSTGEYIVKDGKTNYQIVYPSDAGSYVLSAVEELKLFFSEATNGLKLQTITDGGLTFTNDGKYISIGNTSLLKTSGIVVNDRLGNDGTQIETKGQTIFLFGKTEKADLYAVYDFLYYILDFDYMYKGVYSLDKNVKEIKLKDYHLINIPDIEIRAAGYGWEDSDATMMNRMRMVGLYSPLLNINGAMIHNSFKYVKDYIKGHEGYWYGTNENQLCYTARGNSEEYEAMQNACLETLKNSLKEDLNARMVSFTQEDHNVWCSCNACKSIETQYGSKSAVLVLFMNDLRAKLDAWFATDDGKPYYRDMDLVFFSYHQTNTAPAKYDATTNSYVATIRCNPGVAVWYAPIEADYTHSLLHESNQKYYATLKGWNAVSDHIYLWTYSAPFHNYLVWYNSFESMRDTYKLAKESGAIYLFDQAQYGPCTVPFAWGALKSYLNCKLAWNVNADIVKLTDRFFKAAYGPVAEEMKEYYLKQRVYLTYLTDNTSYACTRSCSNGDIGQKSFWPKPVLMAWLDDINKVVSKIDDLKRSNPSAYKFYYNNIALERLSVYAQLVDLYSSNTSSDQILEYKMQFISDAMALNIGLTSEQSSRSLSDIKRDWGVS